MENLASNATRTQARGARFSHEKRTFPGFPLENFTNDNILKLSFDFPLESVYFGSPIVNG